MPTRDSTIGKHNPRFAEAMQALHGGRRVMGTLAFYRPLATATEADWFASALRPRLVPKTRSWALHSILPAGFDSYVHIPHPEWAPAPSVHADDASHQQVAADAGPAERSLYGQPVPIGTRSDAQPAAEGVFSGPWARRVFQILVRASHPAQLDCFCAFWEGNGRGRPTATFQASWNSVYWLYSASLAAIADSLENLPSHFGSPASDMPNMIWPKTREWCLVTPYNYHSTLVGGSDRLVAELLDLAPDVDVRTVSLEAPLSFQPPRQAT